MATANPFDLLGDDDNDDPSQLLAAQHQKIPAKKPLPQPPKSAKLPSKPLPPAQAGRGGGRGRGYGQGRGGFNRDFANNESSFEQLDSGRSYERRGGGYGGPRGGVDGEGGDGERPRRVFERLSGTGRGNEFKHEGAGRGNWGSRSEEFNQVNEEVKNEGEKHLDAEKPTSEDVGINKENPTNEPEKKEPEDKEMTLEEYEKILEEKRKSLMALKTEERKVKIDKELASMQPLSNKKSDEEIFVKLGSNKDKRKENSEKVEKAKKLVSINEFLKPVKGEKYFSPGGRGRGRGDRGSRGGFLGPNSTQNYGNAPTSIAIEDPGQFPTLGAM